MSKSTGLLCRLRLIIENVDVLIQELKVSFENQQKEFENNRKFPSNHELFISGFDLFRKYRNGLFLKSVNDPEGIRIILILINYEKFR